MNPLPASTLAADQRVDDYRVLETIGRGGMGTVYRAVDVHLEREAALKVLHANLAGEAQYLERFRNEARALARFNHPHIVQVYGVGTAPQGTYIAMEYLAGRTLGHVADRGAHLPWPCAVGLLRRLLDALATAHAAGVVHRDIKPRNIMLTPEPSVKLMDFGIAQLRHTDRSVTATRTVAGTLHYMSPEQVHGLKNVDAQTDLYSLGLTFYQVLAGRLPFDADQSEFAILRAIAEEEWPALDALAPAVPEALAAAVMRAVAKPLEERFASAAAMRAALDGLPDSLDCAVSIAVAASAVFSGGSMEPDTMVADAAVRPPAVAKEPAAAAPASAVSRGAGLLGRLFERLTPGTAPPAPPPPAPAASSPQAARHGATMLLDATAPTAFFDASVFHGQTFQARDTAQVEHRYAQIEHTIHFYRDNLSREYSSLLLQAKTTYFLWVACVSLGFVMLLVGMGAMLMGNVAEGAVTAASTTVIYFIQKIFQQREDHYRSLADAKRAFLEYGNHWLLVLHSISGITDASVREQRQARLVEVMMAKMQMTRRAAADGPTERPS